MRFLARLLRTGALSCASIGLALALSACAPNLPPRYLVDLAPWDTTAVSWEQGRRVVVASSPSCRVRVSYADARGAKVQRDVGGTPYDQTVEMAQFHVSLENLAEDTVEIDPAGFDALVRRSGTPGGAGVATMASIDREQMVKAARLSKLRVEQQENPYRITGIELVGEGLGAVAGILTLFSKQTEEERKENEERRERADDDRRRREQERRDWDARHAEQLESWNGEVSYWSRDVLGRTTLAPGETASGLVVFPFDLRAQAVELRFPVGGTVHQLAFRQQVTVLHADGRSTPLECCIDPAMPESERSSTAERASAGERSRPRRVGSLSPLD